MGRIGYLAINAGPAGRRGGEPLGSRARTEKRRGFSNTEKAQRFEINTTEPCGMERLK